MGHVIASIHERRDEFRKVLRRAQATGAAEPFRARRTAGKRST
jgi:CPA2 family monovalent cation:H+ antiporter-2